MMAGLLKKHSLAAELAGAVKTIWLMPNGQRRGKRIIKCAPSVARNGGMYCEQAEFLSCMWFVSYNLRNLVSSKHNADCCLC
jgi:hypothetical protein